MEIESPAWLIDPSSDVQEIVEPHELSKQVYQALDELPEVFRSSLTLIDLNEMDYTEASEALNVPLVTVKSRLARARLQMQQKLKNIGRNSNRSITNEACLALQFHDLTRNGNIFMYNAVISESEIEFEYHENRF